MRIIFLGVANLDRTSRHFISEVCLKARAKIVLTSNLRLKYSRAEILPLLGILGYHLFTGPELEEWKVDSDPPSRGHQIRRWLCDRVDIEAYIIIDSPEAEADLEYSSNKLVKVKNDSGFREPQYDMAYLMLTN